MKASTLHSRALAGSVAGFLAFASGLLLNVFQVPLILHFWSAETYGAWLVIVAGTSFLTLLDGGHQGYIGNLINRYYVTDPAQCRRILASAVWFAALTAAIQILIGAILCSGPWAIKILGGTAATVPHMALSLFIMMTGWISLGSVSSIIVRLYVPAGLYARSTLISSGFNLLRLAAIVLAASLSDSMLIASCLYVLFIVVGTVFVLVDVKQQVSEYYPWWKGGSMAVGWINFKTSLVLSGTQFLDGLANQGLLVFIGNRFSVESIPLFTSMRTLANSMMQVTNIILAPLTPDMVRFHVTGEGKKLGEICMVVWLFCSVFVVSVLLIGLPWVEPVYGWWTRGKLAFDPLLFSLLALAIVVRCLSSPISIFLQSLNHLSAQAVSTFIRAVITLGGSAVLSFYIGWAAIGVALISSELIAGFAVYLYFLRRTEPAALSRVNSRTCAALFLTMLICISGLAVFIWDGKDLTWVCPLLTVGNLINCWWQWTGLSLDAKKRIAAVLHTIRGRFAGFIPKFA
jgi:O-antigen/teichoic acid export membrane protein